MSDNTVNNSTPVKPVQGKHRNVHKLVQVAMLSAVATVL